MKAFRFVLLCVLCLAVGSGCGSPDLPSLTSQIVEQLQTIKDEASAKAARPRLESIAKQIDAIQEQTKRGRAPAVSNPDDFGKRYDKAMAAYAHELSRIGEVPEAAKELDVMLKIMAP